LSAELKLTSLPDSCSSCPQGGKFFEHLEKSMSNLHFGLNVPTSAEPGADPVAAARRAEELGFDFISSSDHPGGKSPNLETWTMLSWIAACTSHIQIATRVLGVPFRPPPLVAKMAATLDHLSGGRLILGLGGGSGDDEFHAYGLGIPSPRDKTTGLEEALKIIRGMWSEPSFSFEGERYSTFGAELEPKPGRHIPIWLGTFAPRALAVTGRLADGWFPSHGYAPPDEVKVMRERVLAAAERAGRDVADFTCAYNVEVRIGRGDGQESLVSGTANEVAEQLVGFVGLGFSAINLMLSGPDPDEQAAQLAADVIPIVRQAA
jgi:alkanesulfonate monooxygenase SsuD/methylene tetrahydromethanopterin reductase-like flavin-dependent oxidoreductase (luciferase family)